LKDFIENSATIKAFFDARAAAKILFDRCGIDWPLRFATLDLLARIVLIVVSRFAPNEHIFTKSR
jgi:hypothetical protein